MICPLVGVYRPAIMLKKVVFPAPFGPIRLTMARSSIVKSTLLTATSPPNRLVMPRAVSSSAIATSGANAAERAVDQRFFAELVQFFLCTPVHLYCSLPIREDTFRPRQHQDDQRQAKDAELVL